MELGKTGARSIYNFDHGISTEGEFNIGPYRIYVSNGRILEEAIPQLSRVNRGGGRFTSKGFQEVITELPATPGKWMPTAVVEEHPNLDEPSLLLPGNPWNDGAYDLSLILSLLTGKHVAVGNEAEAMMPMIAGQALVSVNFFEQPKVDWTQLAELPKFGGGDAIYAICLAMTTTNMQIKIGMASGALDTLVTRWRKNSQLVVYSEDVKNQFKAASKAFEAKLIDEEMDPDIIKDIMARLPNMMTESALKKLQAFLAAFDMFPVEASEDALKRLRWLNTVRNSVAHSAAVRLDLGENPEASFRVAASVALIMQTICQVYIARYLLNINDIGINDAQRTVRRFFESGRYNGQEILTEDYEEFQRRIEVGGLESSDICF